MAAKNWNMKYVNKLNAENAEKTKYMIARSMRKEQR